MKAAPLVHWRKTPGIKPPCGKVSMYVRPEPARVTCPVCLAAMPPATCPFCVTAGQYRPGAKCEMHR